MTEIPSKNHVGPRSIRHIFRARRGVINKIERFSPQSLGLRTHQQSSECLVRSRDVNEIPGGNVAEYLEEYVRYIYNTDIEVYILLIEHRRAYL